MSGSSIVFVNTSDDLLASQIASQISNDPAFINQSKEYALEANHADLLILLCARLTAFLSGASEVQIQTVFAGLTVFIQKNPNTAIVQHTIEACLAANCDNGDTATHALSLMQGLTILFNALPLAFRCDIFLAIVNIASRGNVMDILLPQLASTEAWVTSWQLTTIQQRHLYLTITQALSEDTMNVDTTHSYDYLVKYLATFSEGEDTSSAYALKALSHAIRLPAVLNVDELLSLPAVKAHQSHPLYRLAHFLALADIAAALAFIPQNASQLTASGLTTEMMHRKFRFAALKHFAASHLLQPVSFSEISHLIHTDEKHVESLIIDAVRLHLIDARIDQMLRKVTFTRVADSPLNASHWLAISSKLSSWRQKVDNMLSSLEETTGPKMVNAAIVQ